MAVFEISQSTCCTGPPVRDGVQSLGIPELDDGKIYAELPLFGG